jgi:hypothetical protein
VGFIKKNFVQHRIFHNIDSWNEQCQHWLDRTGNGKIHNGTKRRPADVFLLEKQHMRQVSLLNHNSSSSITRSVRKDNTVLYLSNRYTVPLGTYQKHPEVQLIPNKENKLIIYVKETGEVLASHLISPEKGQLIRNTSHQRDRSKGMKELMEAVSSHFTNDEMAHRYFLELRNRYPRYLRDQLSIVKKCIDVSSIDVLDDSLELCMERHLFSANDFQDVVQLLKRQRQVNRNSQSAIADYKPTSADVEELPLLNAEAKQRPFDQYVAIMEGGK